MKKSIKSNILEKITQGEIRLRSRFSVLAEKVGLGSSAVLMFFVLILIAGLVSYWLRENSDLFFGEYGQYGLRVFLQSFPFLLIGIFLLLFILLTFLLRKYDISYKQPFILLLSVVFGVVLIGGWLWMRTPLGSNFYHNRGRQFIKGQTRGKNYLIGRVVGISGSQLILIAADEKETIVRLTETTHFSFGQPEAGDEVRVVGEWKEDTFRAFGIRVFETEFSGKGHGLGPKWTR